jgi:histidinol-phosphate aminotransferase
MAFKTNINSLVRVQTSENRDVINGTLLDRNERVESFNDKTYRSIIKNISRFSLNATPDIQNLYKKISKLFKVKKHNIYIGQGITELMSHIIFSLVKKNEEVVILDPTYPMYEVLCSLHGVKYKKWKFNKSLSLEINDLKKIISNKTRVIFLVNPNLPIEFEFDKKLKKEIYKMCIKKNIILAYDEAYYHFGSKTEIKNATTKKNIIVMRTFSKAWGLPSIRLGFLVTNKKLCEYISKCRSLVETNALSYQVAMWALKNKKILNNHVSQIKSGSKFIHKSLKKLNIFFKGGNVTNAVLIQLDNKKEAEEFRIHMRKKKIYIRGNFKERIENCVRISLGPVNKMKIFIKAFENWLKIKK